METVSGAATVRLADPNDGLKKGLFKPKGPKWTIFHWETEGRFRKRMLLANVPSFWFSFWGNIRTYPRSGFRSGGTSECNLVPVFRSGEHPNVPSFRFFVPGEHPPRPPFWKPPFCQNQPPNFGPANAKIRLLNKVICWSWNLNRTWGHL